MTKLSTCVNRCWVGKKHLDAAVQRLSDDFDFHIHWKPFLLNPHMREEGVPSEEYLRNKFGPEAAQRFWSDKSALVQGGQAVVSLDWAPACQQ